MDPAPLSAQTDGDEQALSVGPYLIAVAPARLRDTIGPQLIVVNIRDAQEKQPVPGATVTIHAWNETDQAGGSATALSTTAEPLLYSAQVKLDTPGLWRLSVAVTSPLGEALVDLPPTQVRFPARDLGGTLIYALVLATIASGGAYLWYKARRTSRSGQGP